MYNTQTCPNEKYYAYLRALLLGQWVSAFIMTIWLVFINNHASKDDFETAGIGISMATVMALWFAPKYEYIQSKSADCHFLSRRKRKSREYFARRYKPDRQKKQQATLPRMPTNGCGIESSSMEYAPIQLRIPNEGMRCRKIQHGSGFLRKPQIRKSRKQNRINARIPGHMKFNASPVGSPGDVAMRASWSIVPEALLTWAYFWTNLPFQVARSIVVMLILLTLFLQASTHLAIILTYQNLIYLYTQLQYGGMILRAVSIFANSCFEESGIKKSALMIIQATFYTTKKNAFRARINRRKCALFVLFLLCGVNLKGRPPQKGQRLAAAPMWAGEAEPPAAAPAEEDTHQVHAPESPALVRRSSRIAESQELKRQKELEATQRAADLEEQTKLTITPKKAAKPTKKKVTPACAYNSQEIEVAEMLAMFDEDSPPPDSSPDRVEGSILDESVALLNREAAAMASPASQKTIIELASDGSESGGGESPVPVAPEDIAESAGSEWRPSLEGSFGGKFPAFPGRGQYFEAAPAWRGAQDGAVFKRGKHGVGYYFDRVQAIEQKLLAPGIFIKNEKPPTPPQSPSPKKLAAPTTPTAKAKAKVKATAKSKAKAKAKAKFVWRKKQKENTDEDDEKEHEEIVEAQTIIAISSKINNDTWKSLDDISLEQEWRLPCSTIRDVPGFFAGSFREAMNLALKRIENTHDKSDADKVRAWKLFFLLPRMLLSRTKKRGEEGKEEFFQRFRKFKTGNWTLLIRDARLPPRKKKNQSPMENSDDIDKERRKREAHLRVYRSEVSHARQALEGQALAPGNEKTRNELCAENKRPRNPRSPDLLEELAAFKPATPVELDEAKFFSNVRSARRGISGGLSGMRNEHLKCVVYSPRESDLSPLFKAASLMANAQLPLEIQAAVALARMTALDKGNNQVRGIATGDTFRRVVAKTLAQQFALEFDQACSPFQFALSTRAGTDCLYKAVASISQECPEKVIISLDGIGAYDHIDRAAMLGALRNLPTANVILPFVSMFYGKKSTYLWTDEESIVHYIEQGDGGEQGDPLMPALFALGQHAALVAAKEKLNDEDCLFAFLDDLYAITNKERAKSVFDTVTKEVETLAGIRTNLGKLQLYCAGGGEAPRGFEEMQAMRTEDAKKIWTSDSPQPQDRGIIVLGSPLGSPEFCEAFANERMRKEEKLLAWLPELEDAQVSWLLLYFCAVPRANHILRLLPPSLSVKYAEKHDQAIQRCLVSLLNCQPLSTLQCGVASLRGSLGGLGLRSATRTAAAAYWAAWADALPMLLDRLPHQAGQWVAQLITVQSCEHDNPGAPGELPPELKAAEESRRLLVAEGFAKCPTWQEIADRKAPPNLEPEDREPGEWGHGWQFFASRAREQRFLDFELKPNLDESSQALLLSQGGPHAAQFLQAIPTAPQFQLKGPILPCLLRRRLRLPLPDGLAHCPAKTHGFKQRKTTTRVPLDVYGDHLSACMATGRVQRRANILEKVWAQVFREAGGTIVPNEQLCNTRCGVDPSDKRRVEFAVYNLPFFRGIPLFADPSPSGMSAEHQKTPMRKRRPKRKRSTRLSQPRATNSTT